MEQVLDSFEQEQVIHNYAGFWIRVAAYLIDGIVLIIPQVVLQFVVLGPDIMLGNSDMDKNSLGALGLSYALSFGLQWLYFAIMESSGNQATVGKIAVGIKVINSQGNRMSFLNATGRYFGKFLSTFIILIGYIMVGFDERKQGLHDKLANTLVVYK